MSFKLPYISNNRRRQSISLPDFYLGFVSEEDASQLCFGLRITQSSPPSRERIKQAAIKLAQQRKEGCR